MPSPEHGFRIREFRAPDKTGGDSVGSTGSENPLIGSNKDKLVATLRTLHQGIPGETLLKSVEIATVLPALEESGIVPVFPPNPNPFNAELEEEQHEQWWEVHPEKGQEFSRVVEKREEVLHYLYLGSRMRRLTGGKMYRGLFNLSELTDDQLPSFLRLHYENTPTGMVEQAFERHDIPVALLEEAGIVPVALPLPNDFFDWETEQRRRWHEENPVYHKREETLTYLHIGAILDRLLEKSFIK